MTKTKTLVRNATRVLLLSHVDDKFVAEYLDVRLYEDCGLIKPTGLKLNRKDMDFYFHMFTKSFGVDYFDTLSRNDMVKLIFCFLSLGRSTRKVVVSFKSGNVVNYQVIC